MTVANEFSRVVRLEEIEEEARTVALEADAAEREALAERFDLAGLDELAGEARIERLEGELFSVTVAFRARAEQRCVVTFDPVPAAVEQTVRRLISLVPLPEPEDEFGDADQPDHAPDGVVDLGEIAAEEFALALEPYPRAPHADEVLDRYAPKESEAPRNRPFDALRRLRH